MVFLGGRCGFSPNWAPLYWGVLCPRKKMTAALPSVPEHSQTAPHKGSARLLGRTLSSCSSRQVMGQDPESCCRAADMGLTCRSLLIAWPVHANWIKLQHLKLGLCKTCHVLLCDGETRKTVYFTSIRKKTVESWEPWEFPVVAGSRPGLDLGLVGMELVL